MREQDATLQYLSERIDSLSAEYERAKSNTSHLHDQMESAWQSLHDLQEEYREYKEQASYEFQESQYCWSMHDGAGAKEHSENGHLLNEKKAGVSLYLDGAHAKFDSEKSEFDKAVAYQRGIKEQLDQARNEHKLRIEELKAQNLREQMHWKEKSCGRCGATIRYNDTWNHIPNYCKSCKEKMNAEREEREKKKAAEAAKWMEKPCKQCGRTIRYNIEWSNQPNFCPECKEKFEYEKREREKNRREKSCERCGKTIVYYTTWNHIPNYCKDCKSKFEEEQKSKKKKQDNQGSQNYKLRFNYNTGKNDFYFGNDKPKHNDGHGHVIIGDDGQVHHVRDQYDPKSATDRNDAVSYDDGYFFGKGKS